MIEIPFISSLNVAEQMAPPTGLDPYTTDFTKILHRKSESQRTQPHRHSVPEPDSTFPCPAASSPTPRSASRPSGTWKPMTYPTASSTET